MINKVILVGNLGRDPEVKSTQGGGSVCKLSIATTERQKDKSGEWADHTEWHTVVCFGNTADNVGRFLKKGRQVYVEGKLRTEKWKDKEGKDRYTTEVIAFEVKFLGGGQGEGGGDRGRDSDDRGNSRAEPDRGRETGGRGGRDRQDDRGRDDRDSASRDSGRGDSGPADRDDGCPF